MFAKQTCGLPSNRPRAKLKNIAQTRRGRRPRRPAQSLPAPRGELAQLRSQRKKRRRDLKQLCCPLVEIVVSVAYAWRAPDTPFLLPFRPRFIAHRARSDSIALAGYPALKELKSLLRSQRKKETDRNGLSLFLAEKERFELSRRVYPTYTLSRGASSANLSTSPYLQIAVFQICYIIISYLLTFVNTFLLFF